MGEWASEYRDWRLGVTAVAVAAAATGAVEVTWPIAAIAMAYILGQAAVDTWGE